MDAERVKIKNLILSKLNRKLILIFSTTSLIVTSIVIFYLYLISVPSLNNSSYIDQSILIKVVLITTIFLIIVEAIIIDFLIIRFISKPLKSLINVTKEIEKGNYYTNININTNDEIAEFQKVFNKLTSTLAKLEYERKEMDNIKTEFLSIVSHEIRNPITPIKAQLQMLLNEYFGNFNEKQKKSLEIIARNTDRLDNLIVDFLEITRIENAKLKFNFTKTDIENVIKDAVQFMEPYAKEKNIEIMADIEKLPKIQTDPDRVNQVLRNLINNAIKFSNENSKIEISAKLDKDYILFSIKDYGCGLSSENQIRIFEPFYQVENINTKKQGGTGLGLTICRGIIESQKGKIWVDSDLGEGSKFNFTLPLTPNLEIEPIKILFSPKVIIEKKIQKEFKKRLGPLGYKEFNHLKIKKTLQKEDIYDYISSLVDIDIITKETGFDFKNKINEIFGDKKQNLNIKMDIDNKEIYEVGGLN